MTIALQVEVHAPIASFRNPLYAGVQVGLPCPPPSTVGGLLASAAGGWPQVPLHTRFAMCFTAKASGTDLETYHPLDAGGGSADPTPKDREFLADVTLVIWLIEDLDLWDQSLRRPAWPLRLGRSQDLASARGHRVELAAGSGRQGQAVLPAESTSAGTLLRLPTAISHDRARTRWDAYRYAATRGDAQLDDALVTPDGQAVVLLPQVHPDLVS